VYGYARVVVLWMSVLESHPQLQHRLTEVVARQAD
jgi:hypothetical protein